MVYSRARVIRGPKRGTMPTAGVVGSSGRCAELIMGQAAAPSPASPERLRIDVTPVQAVPDRAARAKPSRPPQAPRLPARPIVIINASIEHTRLRDDHAIEGRHIECPSAAHADDVFLTHPDAELLAMVCDGRDWVVARALARLKLAPQDAPPINGLLSRRELLDELALWIDRSSASLRLVELDALHSTSRADRRVQLMIEQPRAVSSSSQRQIPLWRWWLTEDQQALFRSAAGSLLAELGYTRRDDL